NHLQAVLVAVLKAEERLPTHRDGEQTSVSQDDIQQAGVVSRRAERAGAGDELRTAHIAVVIEQAKHQVHAVDGAVEQAKSRIEHAVQAIDNNRQAVTGRAIEGPEVDL